MIPTLTFFLGACFGWLFASLCAARKTPEPAPPVRDYPHIGDVVLRVVDFQTGRVVSERCTEDECWCGDPVRWAETNGSQCE